MEERCDEEVFHSVERVEIHHTPKRGTWLNVAECELSVLSRHCLRTRTGAIETLRYNVTAWQRECSERQCGVDWRFTTDDARIRLKRLYPQYQAA